MQVGTQWMEEIHLRLQWCEVFIVLLSSASQDSEMVQYEARMAWQRYQHGSMPLIFPIRLNDFGALNYEMDKYLGKLQYFPWREPGDNPQLWETLRQALQHADTSILPPSTPTDSPRIGDPLRPQAAIDPRGLIVPGGTAKSTDPYYLERSADAVARDLATHPGETLVIKAPRQMGKSSLLLRYLITCRTAGKQVVFIDLSQFSDHDMVEYPCFLTRITHTFLRSLQLYDTPQYQIQTQQDFIWYLEDYILRPLDSPLAIAFDETDRLLGREYQANFFTMLRYWHNARAELFGSWENTDLALAISTEPYLLIKEADRSPFNVGLTQELVAFTFEECQMLNEKYGNFLNNLQVTQLWDLLGGHPYLTRLAYYRLLATDRLDFNALLKNAHDERGPFGDHLRALLAKLHQNPELSDALKKAIRTGEVVEPDHYYRLYGAGLIQREGKRVNPTNLLYARFFKQTWL